MTESQNTHRTGTGDRKNRNIARGRHPRATARDPETWIGVDFDSIRFRRENAPTR